MAAGDTLHRDWCRQLVGCRGLGGAKRQNSKPQALRTQQPQGNPVDRPRLGLLEIVREQNVGAQRDNKPDQVRRVEEVPAKK